MNLRLWDESDRKLISWKEYRQRYAQPVVDTGRVNCGELLRSGISHDVLGAPVRRMAFGADRHHLLRAPGHRAAGLVVDAHHRDAGVLR